MSRPDEQEPQDGLEDIANLLRSERPQATNLELDRIKTRATARARSARGGRTPMRARIIVAIVAVGLMAAGTGSVIASEGGGSTQATSNAAKSQYVPPKCGPGQSKSQCSCPDHSELEFNHEDEKIECECPEGSSFNSKGNSCECPNGMEMLNGNPPKCSCPPNQEVKNGKCEHVPPPPPPPPEGECKNNEGTPAAYCKGNNLTHCIRYCEGNNNTPACVEHCIGNNNSKCKEFCDGNNNSECTKECKGSNNPKCKEDCSKQAAYETNERTSLVRLQRRARAAARNGRAYAQGRARLIRT